MAQAVGEDVESQCLTQEELDQKPWKYIGYKEFTKYASSDDDFFALRRFDRVHCRLLLMLQSQVAGMGIELDIMVERLSQRDAVDIDNGSARQIPLSAYSCWRGCTAKSGNELLCRYTSLKARPKAAPKTITNIKTWLVNNNHPICPQEAASFDARDLISLASSPKSAFRRLVEQHLLGPTRGLFGIFRHNPPLGANDRVFQDTHHGSDDQVDSFASVIIFISATTMLIAPLWILTVVNTLHQKLATITTFLVVFLAILTWGTLSKPFEILAATAG
ncbi:hypothetical protein B0T16DRAFT_493658 [Cercophora newfieldiana]|uniref:DUF6594 domain-containing protein n=1 Tax=Cercophora newfieldiana TaxID=92897 RepID=A0AA39Y644_9PEZI|nr:hypothetical protein B0T16DRAFT_493658 [Cercophora newfieldiana]